MKDIEWDQIYWPKVDFKVNALQERIYKVSLDKNKYSVRYLQEILINTPEAKLLAVRQVTTENKGRKTGSVDKQLTPTKAEKIKLARNLKIDGKVHLIRRTVVNNFGTNLPRPLGIATIRDCAKQALLKLALEPEWEGKFEPNSYGFRPGRSCHDAVEAIFGTIKKSFSVSGIDKWVLAFDLKGCFDNINHDYLLKKLDTSVKFKTQISAWLKAGILEGYMTTDRYEEIESTEMVTLQGTSLSPFLVNILLDGLEEHLKTWNSQLPSTTKEYMRPRDKRLQICFVRYGDDFVVIHPNRTRLEETQIEIQNWFNQTSKLTLKVNKTSIKSVAHGFDFLGHSFISVNRNGIPRALIYPSKKSQKRLIRKLSDVFHQSKALKQVDVIKRVRPITQGWSNFFKYCECKKTFSKLDFQIYGLIRAWAFRRHPKSGRVYAMNKYFPGNSTVWKGIEYQDRWVFKSTKKVDKQTDKEIFLPKLAWTKSAKFVKVLASVSTYNGDHPYWLNRFLKYKLTESQTKRLKKQSGKCPLCNTKITPSADVQIDHIRGRKVENANKYENLQLVHTHCHIRKTNVALNLL